jgi:hypothetical protein
MSAVLGVVGGSGGVGASTFGAVLAVVAGSSLLVDVDEVGGGIDVLLGIEGVPGARWSSVRVGGGRLDPVDLADGLPRWGGVPVLALDADPPPPAAVDQVLDAAVSSGVVVVDLGRAESPARRAALRRCHFVVALAAGGVRELAAARAVLSGLGETSAGLVLRRGAIRDVDAAVATGVPLLGVIPPLGAGRAPSPSRLPPALVRIAEGVLDGVSACRT